MIRENSRLRSSGVRIAGSGKLSLWSSAAESFAVQSALLEVILMILRLFIEFFVVMSVLPCMKRVVSLRSGH